MSTQVQEFLMLSGDDSAPVGVEVARRDAQGNIIHSTYQKKLTAGTGISISNNTISCTVSGGSASVSRNSVFLGTDKYGIIQGFVGVEPYKNGMNTENTLRYLNTYNASTDNAGASGSTDATNPVFQLTTTGSLIGKGELGPIVLGCVSYCPFTHSYIENIGDYNTFFEWFESVNNKWGLSDVTNIFEIKAYCNGGWYSFTWDYNKNDFAWYDYNAQESFTLWEAMSQGMEFTMLLIGYLSAV